MPTLEDMSMPCPLDICDGTGVLPTHDPQETPQPCPHTESDEDRSEE